MNFSVRPAMAADVATMERIWVDAGREAWAHILRPEALAWLAPPEQLRASPEEGALVLVVEHEGDVVGFAEARDDGSGDAVVRAFYTHPSVWGLGAGRVLMDELLARLRADGFAAARLRTADENHRPQHGPEFDEVGYRIELTSRGPA